MKQPRQWALLFGKHVKRGDLIHLVADAKKAPLVRQRSGWVLFACNSNKEERSHEYEYFAKYPKTTSKPVTCMGCVGA